jgi:hypothetical protein
MPRDLPQTSRVAEDRHWLVRNRRANLHAFGLRGCDGGHRCQACGLGQRDNVRFDLQLARDSPRHVEQIGGQLRLEAHVAIDGLEASTGGGLIELAGAQQVHPAEHGVERCP